jgi:PIN domain nuclease of toxin-antitoxin system
MDYLLDTHTFLWFISDDAQLSAEAVAAITSPDTIKYISIASLWEIAIKLNIGKLELDMPYSALRDQIEINGFEILPIVFKHTVALSALQQHHGDPFDRIIISQAIFEKITVISKDKNFAKYIELKVLW